jgi:DNA primase
MLVHYPEFVDRKSEAIAHVAFTSELEAFRKALYELLIIYEELDVRLIYDKLSPKFYEVLQDIHGDRTDALKRGWHLFQRFPLLDDEPDFDFVEECIDHFIHVLQVEQMADEIKKLRAGPIPEDNEEAYFEELLSLIRNYHLEKEKSDHRGIELAEKADIYKKPVRDRGGPTAPARVLLPAH